MPGVTLDKMREGYSKIRNRALAHAFSYMNLIEAWGSGIPKLLEAMKEYGLREPEFQDLEIGFRINLYRNTEDTVIRCAEENIQRHHPNRPRYHPKYHPNETKPRGQNYFADNKPGSRHDSERDCRKIRLENQQGKISCK